ncbi:hypothetical protein A2U01_0101466 [Trifolium medium]|uniref:Uncharacterized protein n=1 Tax=Trifolium medium TaxID=97028 RepID=A0A392UZQ4_9FABA|nr:hypothetical protein [Trifolium medium]
MSSFKRGADPLPEGSWVRSGEENEGASGDRRSNDSTREEKSARAEAMVA